MYVRVILNNPASFIAAAVIAIVLHDVVGYGRVAAGRSTLGADNEPTATIVRDRVVGHRSVRCIVVLLDSPRLITVNDVVFHEDIRALYVNTVSQSYLGRV